MSIEYDHRSKARAAMEMAAAATCGAERLKWVRIALAWHDLSRYWDDTRDRSFWRSAGIFAKRQRNPKFLRSPGLAQPSGTPGIVGSLSYFGSL